MSSNKHVVCELKLKKKNVKYTVFQVDNHNKITNIIIESPPTTEGL